MPRSLPATMRTPFDQYTKQLLEQALSPTGQVTTDTEVLADVQRTDVWYLPDPACVRVGHDRGMLDRIATGPLTLEPFHDAPSLAEVMDVLRKQWTLEHSAVGRKQWARCPDTPPMAWIFAAGRPVGVMRAMTMKPLRSWPQGVYAPPPAFRLRLVVIPLLPRTRDTLLVRLMGRGKVLRQAMEDLDRLPDAAWERGVALPALIQLQLAQQDPATRTDDHEELAMSNLELYERWKKQTEEVGEKRGITEGEKRGIAEGEKRVVAIVGRQFERRLGRVLTDGEYTVLRQRLDTLGPARVGDVVLDLEVTALSDWLKDPAAK